MANDQPTAMPRYIFDRAVHIVWAAAKAQFLMFEPPEFQEQDILDHFIQPADIPVCRRMAEIGVESNCPKSYPLDISLDNWTATVNVPASTSETFFPPDKPTRQDYLERGRSALIDECYALVEHRRDAAHTWGRAWGVLMSLNATLTSMSQLKMLWPDFSLLVAGILKKTDGPTTNVVNWAKAFDKNSGTPRDLPALLPNLGEYIEEIRRAVLAMTLYEDPARRYDKHKVTLTDISEHVRMPWNDPTFERRYGAPAMVDSPFK